MNLLILPENHIISILTQHARPYKKHSCYLHPFCPYSYQYPSLYLSKAGRICYHLWSRLGYSHLPLHGSAEGGSYSAHQDHLCHKTAASHESLSLFLRFQRMCPPELVHIAVKFRE